MVKPNNYDNTTEGGFIPVELGGHTAVIKQVSERKNKNGGDMLVVLFDFDQHDTQPGYFMEQFNKDIRPEKKYPNQATNYINVYDRDGNCTKSFKSFCACYERSNNCQVNWKATAQQFEAQFKGKRIGVVFGEVEEFYDGEVKTRRKMRWFSDYDKAKFVEVPRLVEYKEPAGAAAPSGSTGPFMNIPDGTSDELPF